MKFWCLILYPVHNFSTQIKKFGRRTNVHSNPIINAQNFHKNKTSQLLMGTVHQNHGGDKVHSLRVADFRFKQQSINLE
jgi:hypothetical protein